MIREYKYRASCLGNAIMRKAQEGDVRKFIKANLDKFSWDGDVHKQRELVYLRELVHAKRVYQKVPKFIQPSRLFLEPDEELVDGMRHMVEAAGQFVVIVAAFRYHENGTDFKTLFLFILKLKISSYMRKPYYLYRCNVGDLSGARLKNKVEQLEAKKNMTLMEIKKYMDVIEELIENDQIIQARRQVELLIDYKNRVSYKPNKHFHWIFYTFSTIQYLKFQNLDHWNEEENRKRKLYLLGLTKGTHELRESLFGVSYMDPR